LLTRRTELWEQLFSQPFGNDKWGRPAVQMMLDALSSSARGATPLTQDAAQHERDAGKRKQLFLAYMDELCGPDLTVVKEDFLGHGDDAGGKARFPGMQRVQPGAHFLRTGRTEVRTRQEQDASDGANDVTVETLPAIQTFGLCCY
jgi:hypothetical protein